MVLAAVYDGKFAPDRMAGTRTGVFIGLSTADWAERTVASGDPERLDAWSLTGVSPSIAAGRISHREIVIPRSGALRA